MSTSLPYLPDNAAKEEGGRLESIDNKLSVLITAVGGGSSGVADQGIPNTQANAWPVYLSDLTNGPVAIKAPNTEPTTADRALVVSISPNSFLTLTDASIGVIGNPI